MKVKIITDSAADFTAEELAKYGVTQISMPVYFDDEPNKLINMDEFWTGLIAGRTAKTSQPAPELFHAEFEQAQAEGYAVVCVLISSRLSATFDSAVLMKKTVGYENVYVVDSRTASMAEKRIVLRACELRDKNLSAQAIAETLNDFRFKVKLYACIDTLKYLARGGRISKAAASVGTLINLKPLITITEEGEVAVFSKCIGHIKANLKLAEKLNADVWNEDYEMIPIFAQNDSNCRHMIQKLAAKGYPVRDEQMNAIGSTIGTHIGPAAFGIVYVIR